MSAEVVPYVPPSYDDGKPRLMIECRECGIEWGWTLERSSFAAYLQTAANEHNHHHHPKGAS